MRKRASVSVFLALCFMLTASLVFAMLESARTAGAVYYLQIIANSALDSVFAEYSRPLWDGYRVALFSCDGEEDLAKKLLTYGEAYLEESNVYRLANPSVAVKSLTRVTEGGGIGFERSVRDYMEIAFVDYAHQAADMEAAWEHVKDARAMEEIGDAYGTHSRRALDLEKKVLAVVENLRFQKQAYEEAKDAVFTGSMERFITEGEKMITLSERLPGLLTSYRDAADDFARELSVTKQSQEGSLQELGEEHRNLMEERLFSYESYVSEEGVRRRELEEAVSSVLSQKEAIVRAVSVAEEILEEEEEWEESDDDSEASGDFEEDSEERAEERLAELLSIWEGVHVPVPEMQAAKPDREKEDRLRQLEGLGSGSLLQLLLPEGRTVSDGHINTGLLPSHTSREERREPEADFLAQMLLNEYVFRYFTDFLSESEDGFSYEIEYILSGKSSDKDNLEAVLLKILGIREGMNYLHILADATKREMADQLAMAITGMLGFPQLYILVSLLIIGVWALAESILDLKDLLKGKRVPLYKQPEDWKLGLEGMMQGSVESWESAGEEGETFGLSYKEYLRMLLFVLSSGDRNYRSMDLMQYNIGGESGDFLMKNMIYGAKILYSADSKRLFSYFAVGGGFGLSPTYRLSVVGAKAY